ncbi:MAG: FtsX-like permease family protein, partial [Desulfitobacterium sp.]|nr:FtsX-like permease family protein [Desulfitobacterium sp.]
MNKTYFKTIFREIKESFGRFAAIFAIVALGVGFLAGLMITTPNMHASADKYYDENNMTDIFIKGTLGLKDEDLQALQEVDEIEKIMPAYVTDVLMDTGEQTMVTRVYGLPLEKLASGSPDFINRLELLEGRLPQKKDECLVGRSLNMEDIELGAVLTISQENDNYEDRGETYHTDQYTVVGIVSNPFYFSIEPEPSNIGNGRVGTVIYVDESNYALDVYTDFYITLKGAQEMVAFSEEYESYVEDVVEKLEVIGEERSELRTAEILGEAQEELEKGKKDYAEGKEKAESELASAWEKIQDGKKALADAQREIAQGEKDLKDGEIALAEERKKVEKELKAKEKELQAGEALLKEGKENLAQAKAQLDAVREDVEQGKALLASGVELPPEVLAQIQEYDSGLAAYEAGMAEIRAKESELAAGKAALEAGRQEAERGFAQGEAELEKARQELAKGKRELEKNQAELEKGEQEYFEEKAKVEKELQEAEEEIAEAEEEIRKIEAGKWYVLDRNSNISYASFSFNSDKIDAIAKVFPIFFLLVAALVALTTMTRMVEEERTQIGTLKALGYTRGRIMSKYIIYCGLASVIGSIVGLLIGFQVFPTVIWGAFTTMYELPSFTTQFNWYFALLTSGAVTLATLLATISVCNQALKEKPAQLMLPRAPKPGKRIFLENIPFIWKRLKFSYKATARNILRYKKHFFMTVIGIAGCTA